MHPELRKRPSPIVVLIALVAVTVVLAAFILVVTVKLTEDRDLTWEGECLGLDLGSAGNFDGENHAVLSIDCDGREAATFSGSAIAHWADHPEDPLDCKLYGDEPAKCKVVA
ncbi:MAG: hypothetical protein A3B23_00255 [Candidatus Colwellbacteria bacterium RIFCSPLOWO2_01_FULL_48_10]|uniref:Uncharacterized protein n=1 Tax=Candidatus Colwellbacteria bacterium RIFCSPLOWO2_01_FULL_48_10 TaxID=1797690 RepID=A0A1G1Z8Y0_9BACT|nr:MAG: hypothetical protein A3B23_00255 [Candidatus Colwellbacteria bacterium RIFCSPLOWO2_01_FULL_48_10]